MDGTLPPWFDGRVISVNESIAERWGVLAGECQLRGTPLITTDGLIAATDLEHDLTVGLGVTIFNPWEYGKVAQ